MYIYIYIYHVYIYIYISCIYIYIYIMCIYIYMCVYIYANFIKHNRHFMPTYFPLDPLEFPYYFYRIRGEFTELHLKANAIIFNGKDVLTQ